MPILYHEIMTLCADHTCPNDALVSRFSATAQPAILPRGQIGFSQPSVTTRLQDEPIHADAARELPEKDDGHGERARHVRAQAVVLRQSQIIPR